MAVPSPAAPARRDRLWEETCFELFLARPGSPGYWELNLSPSGAWNAYRFDAYREGMREETAVAALPLHTRRGPGALDLDLELGLGELVSPFEPLAAGASAVLRRRDGTRTYWALAHGGPAPDFHRRDGFLVALGPDAEGPGA